MASSGPPRKRSRAGAVAAVASTPSSDRRLHDCTGLTVAVVGGWRHVLSFLSSAESYAVSPTCVAFLRATAALITRASFHHTYGCTRMAPALIVSRLTSALARFPNVQHVDLHNCRLVRRNPGRIPLPANDPLPQGLYSSRSLATLDLYANRLVELDPAIGNLASSLTRLDLEKTSLSALAPQLFHCVKLQWLSVRWNPLRVLPPAIGALRCLTTLNIERCLLTVLPVELFDCVALTTLHCAHNAALTILPEEVGQLLALERLELGGCAIAVLPAALGEMPKLELLSFRRTSAFAPNTNPCARRGVVNVEHKRIVSALRANEVNIVW